jgi:hypothetical protein
VNARVCLLGVLAVTSPACIDWRVQWIPPAKVLERQSPSRLRVVLTDSSRLEIRSPRVSHDSLIGRLLPDSLAWSSPLAGVAYVLVPRADVGATFVLVSLVLAVIGGVAGLAAYAASACVMSC